MYRSRDTCGCQSHPTYGFSLSGSLLTSSWYLAQNFWKRESFWLVIHFKFSWILSCRDMVGSSWGKSSRLKLWVLSELSFLFDCCNLGNLQALEDIFSV